MIKTIQILKSEWFFFIVLALKLLIAAAYVSEYMAAIFLPFIGYFVESAYQSPYEYFSNNKYGVNFPYPALMLYLLSLPQMFGEMIGFVDWTRRNSFFLIKIPLIMSDVGIFLIIRSWLNKRFHTRLVIFYWASPVLFFISYIHGQLDIIPIFFVFAALYFLFKEKIVIASIFIGLALATKTHIVVTLPFFLLYLNSKGGRIWSIPKFTTVVSLVFLLCNMQFILSAPFHEMVFFAVEQKKVFDSFLYMNDLTFYFLPAALLLLLLKGGIIRNYSRDIFIMFLGLSLTIILIFVSPKPGWYFWSLPFLAYFFCKIEGRAILLFFGLQASYFMYFMLQPNSDVVGFLEAMLPSGASYVSYWSVVVQQDIDSLKLQGIIFTILQTLLAMNCYWIYSRGIELYLKHKINSAPFLIGIGGDSGSGKTTLSTEIANIFSHSHTSIIYGDDKHRWQRGDKNWETFNHLDPRANNLHSEIADLTKLKSNLPVNRVHYDHNTGKFTGPHKVIPRNVIIFEGLHPFYIKAQRKLYDLKIFIAPNRELADHWKITRDMQHRGYSKEKVLAQLQKRRISSKQFVQVQRDYADILIVPRPVETDFSAGDMNIEPEVMFDVILPNSVFLEDLIAELSELDGLKLDFNYMDNDSQIVTIGGRAAPSDILTVSNNHILGLSDIGIYNPKYPSGAYGVVVLLLVYFIFEESESIDH